jgi:hypothetical protein
VDLSELASKEDPESNDTAGRDVFGEHPALHYRFFNHLNQRSWKQWLGSLLSE